MNFTKSTIDDTVKRLLSHIRISNKAIKAPGVKSSSTVFTLFDHQGSRIYRCAKKEEFKSLIAQMRIAGEGRVEYEKKEVLEIPCQSDKILSRTGNERRIRV